MDETTQQNAALVEEATAAARSMEEQAGHLSDAVSIFRLDEQALAPVAPTPAPRAASRPAPAQAPVRKPAGRAVAAELAEGDWQEF